MELLGNEGVMNRVSTGHDEKDPPTEPRSTTRKFSTPACVSAIATPMPAAPAPMTMTSYVSTPVSYTHLTLPTKA